MLWIRVLWLWNKQPINNDNLQFLNTYWWACFQPLLLRYKKHPFPHSVLETESFTSDGSQGVAVYGEEWVGCISTDKPGWCLLELPLTCSDLVNAHLPPDIPTVSVREINRIIINRWLPNQDWLALGEDRGRLVTIPTEDQ